MTDDGTAEVEQPMLFELAPEWKKTWVGMPEFNQRDLEPFQSVKIHFKSLADRRAFAALIGQPIHDATQSLWYPKAEIGRYADKRWKTDEKVNSRYPIYVPTKGRWESAFTIKALERVGVPYYAVVQPQEEIFYRPLVKTGTILLLPAGLDGLVPARNWIRKHSIDVLGVKRHWQIDDNIQGFFRLHENLKVEVLSGSFFRAMEDFSDRYSNIGISGPNYFMFAPRKSASIRPFTLNTRVYSCSLVNNEFDYWWRAVYNDDTDICLRVLKDGLCTVLFNAFLAYKTTTMALKGGNTPIYEGDGRKKMAESLKEQHPDVVTITRKWGRWQHQVDYKPFRRNALVPRPDAEIPQETVDYGMRLEYVAGQEPESAETLEDLETQRPENAETPGSLDGRSIADEVDTTERHSPSAFCNRDDPHPRSECGYYEAIAS